jgi:hypothetical protein
LADKCSETIPAVAFVLRGVDADGGYGYPPGEIEILTFLATEPPRPSASPSVEGERPRIPDQMEQTIWAHAQAVALLHASFKVCTFATL